ncbi:MAG TPA: hypothetical protein VFE20_09190 [Thermoleophilia bacterium]|nr:hypothetical protein [Thermoleophilia bacterium]
MKTQVEGLQRHWREVDQLISSGRIDGEEDWPEWKLEKPTRSSHKSCSGSSAGRSKSLPPYTSSAIGRPEPSSRNTCPPPRKTLKQQVVEWIFALFTQTYLTAWSAAEERMAYRGRWVG